MISRRPSTSCDSEVEPHVGLVELLAQHAQVAADAVGEQLLIGEALARGRVGLVDLRADGLERLGQRDQRQLQALVLLLQHADVGQDLLVLAVGRAGRRRGHQQGERHERQRDTSHSRGSPLGVVSYFAVTTKCARRFFAHAASVCAGSNGKLLAVADRLDAVGRDAERHQVVARRDRAALAERQVVFGRAALVAVAFDA